MYRAGVRCGLFCSCKARHGLITVICSKSLTQSNVVNAAPLQRLEDSSISNSQIDHLLQPAHVARDSLLYSKSGFDDFRGFYNLAIFALLISNLRLAVENMVKYGFLINPLALASASYELPWLIISGGFFFLAFSWLAIWSLEMHTSRILLVVKTNGWIRQLLQIARCFWLLQMLAVPCVVMWIYHFPIGIAFFYVSVLLSQWMKAVSYVHFYAHFSSTNVAMDLNYAPINTSSSNTATKNITAIAAATDSSPRVECSITHMIYFIFAPTLCYELDFPRNTFIRKRFLLRRCLEMLFFCLLILGVYQQYMSPLLLNFCAMEKVHHKSYYLSLVERTLKLAVPSFMLWLCAFYAFFHCWLNIVGELLGFADRQFYRGFWNSKTIASFWRNWNIPVHKWCVRHLYRPLIANGWSRWSAQLSVFVFSALAHEICVAIPLGIFRPWSFLAMLSQVPLALLTEKSFLKDSEYGNVIVWASLFLGQPVAVMMYISAYLGDNQL